MHIYSLKHKIIHFKACIYVFLKCMIYYHPSQLKLTNLDVFATEETIRDPASKWRGHTICAGPHGEPRSSGGRRSNRRAWARVFIVVSQVSQGKGG